MLKVSMFLLVFPLLSCQSVPKKTWQAADVLLPVETTVESISFPQSVSKQQMDQDIDFLIYVMTKAYGGIGHVSPDLLQKSFQALKAASDAHSMKEFHEKIDDALYLIPDNHLQSVYRSRVGPLRSADEKNQGQVGTNNITNSKNPWEVRVDKLANKKILYISITRFPPSASSVWKDFLPSVKKNLSKANAIVIDVRGNGGGDDTQGMKLAELLYGRPFAHPIHKQYRRQTPETWALQINYVRNEIAGYNYDKEAVPEFVKNQLAEYSEAYDQAIKGLLPAEHIRTNKGGGNRTDPILGFKKPIYILTDRACGSSGEFTAAAFEWHPYAKRVGENTAGTFHFSNDGLAILPNSKIRVFIPSQHSEYFDQRFVERTGLAPQIAVPNGQDAYQFVKQLMKLPK